jgi:integrase
LSVAVPVVGYDPLRLLPLDELARQNREALKDKGYRVYPLGQEAGRYLRANRKRLTKDTYRDYEGCLDKFARHFADLEIRDFEPPVGTERLEEFLDHQWGHREPRTYNKNHSVLNEFFRFQRLRGELHGDPMLNIRRAKARGVHRSIFSPDQRRAIFAANPDQPDITALRLLLTYGLRKGALQTVRFEHFDFSRRELTIFTKGGKVQTVPIPEAAFWAELDVYMRSVDAMSFHYLLCRHKTTPKAFGPNRKATEFQVILFPEQPTGGHGLHSWWYRCLAAAGIVPAATESGERMHKARHTSGQRVLDQTGNLKAVQALLGHSDIATTGNVYTDWDIDRLRDTLAGMEDE